MPRGDFGSMMQAHNDVLRYAQRLQAATLSQIDAQYRTEESTPFQMTMEDFLDELDKLGEDGFNEKYRPILQAALEAVTQQEGPPSG